MMPINKINKKEYQVQIMACSGLLRSKAKIKGLDMLFNMGCEKISTINDLFSKA